MDQASVGELLLTDVRANESSCARSVSQDEGLVYANTRCEKRSAMRFCGNTLPRRSTQPAVPCAIVQSVFDAAGSPALINDSKC